jgi:hypothetical protein
MRSGIVAKAATVVLATGVLAAASGAIGAPTCQRLDGLAARCGTPGAMPVAWQPTPRQLLDMRLARPPQDVGFEVLGSICLLGALATLIALMPPFDGWEPGDWDEQEGEPRKRR